MKAPFSPYLDSIASGMKALTDILSRSFDYVSILSTDSVGFQISISQRSKRVSGTNMTTERGNVVRVCRGGQYSEYAFNQIPERIEDLADEILRELERQFALMALTGVKAFDTPLPEDEPLALFVEKETGRLPETEDMQALVETFTRLSDRGMEIIPRALDCMLNASSTHISKMFITKNRFLRQSYV